MWGKKLNLLLVGGWLLLIILLCASLSVEPNVIAARTPYSSTAFGNGGIVRTNFPYRVSANTFTMQSDGKLIVAGSIYSGSNTRFLLVRYLPDGMLDSTFGDGGSVITDIDQQSSFSAIGLQLDGKIVAAGSSGGTFAIARYNSDGSLDSTFGEGGIVMPDFGTNAFARGIVVRPNGEILAVGTIQESPSGPGDIGVVRLNTNGSLDPTFNGGMVTLDLGGNEVGEAVDVDIAGRPVVVGTADDDYIVLRLLGIGQPDLSFAEAGVLTVDFGSADHAKDVLIQLDARILVAGNAGLLRVNNDGSLDSSFGDGGLVADNYAAAAVMRIASQDDGKLVVAGGNHLVRYLVDGSRDPEFGSDGEATVEALTAVTGLATRDDENEEKILVSGSSENSTIVLAVYHGNGELDASTNAYLPMLFKP